MNTQSAVEEAAGTRPIAGIIARLRADHPAMSLFLQVVDRGVLDIEEFGVSRPEVLPGLEILRAMDLVTVQAFRLIYATPAAEAVFTALLDFRSFDA